jgi:site-specific recombinase XerD
MTKETNARLYRRHRTGCKFRGVENSWAMLNCNCPLYGDGYIDGKRVLRKSLDTRNQAVASKRLGDLMAELTGGGDAGPTALTGKPVGDAVEAFLAHHGAIAADGSYKGEIRFSTYRKYRNSIQKLEAFCTESKIANIGDLGLEQLDAFRGSRHVSGKTSRNELQLLRKFWAFALKRKWVTENVAKSIDGPKGLIENEIEPYTALEESRILSACDSFGRSSYERLRARAMTQLHRFTGLAISDVATLARSRMQWHEEKQVWKVLVRRLKTGKQVFLPIPDELKATLDGLPLPRGAAGDCPYYFWNGVTSQRAAVGIAERTMSAVFKKSGVANAGTHRFRHTLATRLLARGAAFEEIADILGNTPEIVRKHYAKWSKGRQDRIDDVMLGYVGALSEAEPNTRPLGYSLGTKRKMGHN